MPTLTRTNLQYLSNIQAPRVMAMLMLMLLAGCVVMTRTACAEPAGRLPLAIGVYDYANIPVRRLEHAQNAVVDLYAGIGVEIQWRSGRSFASDPAALSIIILDAQMTDRWAPPKDVLGGVPGTRVARGRVAYAFYGRVMTTAATSDETTTLLSLVMAHEIGHLLLPHGSHTPAGIMRGHWEIEELRWIDMRSLTFTSTQIQQVRQFLERSDESLADQ